MLFTSRDSSNVGALVFVHRSCYFYSYSCSSDNCSYAVDIKTPQWNTHTHTHTKLNFFRAHNIKLPDVSTITAGDICRGFLCWSFQIGDWFSSLICLQDGEFASQSHSTEGKTKHLAVTAIGPRPTSSERVLAYESDREGIHSTNIWELPCLNETY